MLQRLEHIGVQHLVPISTIEPFNKGILIRLVGLNIPERDLALLAPDRKPIGKEFGAVIQPNRLRAAPPGHHLLQHANHPVRGQGGIDFDR